MFDNPDRFMEAVRAGFAPVYRPRSYAFEPPIVADGLPAKPVRLIGPDGRGVIALYRMEEQPDGSWRIAGVTLHPIAERGIRTTVILRSEKRGALILPLPSRTG
jgi:hypothetical protein